NDDIASVSFTTRWHMVARRREQALAEHHYRVAMYGLKVNEHVASQQEDSERAQRVRDFAPDVLAYALVHDVDEVAHGDVCTATKAAVGREHFRGLSVEFWAERGLEPPAETFPRVVRNVVKVADILDGYVFAYYNVGGGPEDRSPRRRWVLDGWREAWRHARREFDAEYFPAPLALGLEHYVFEDRGGISAMHA